MQNKSDLQDKKTLEANSQACSSLDDVVLRKRVEKTRSISLSLDLSTNSYEQMEGIEDALSHGKNVPRHRSLSLQLDLSNAKFIPMEETEQSKIIQHRKIKDIGAEFILIMDWDNTIIRGCLDMLMHESCYTFRNLRKIQEIFMKVYSAGGCIAIATYSNHLQEIEKILSEHFGEMNCASISTRHASIVSEKISIYGGLVDSNFGKRLHIKCISNDSGIYDKKKIIFVDDNYNNYQIALEDGYLAVYADIDDKETKYLNIVETYIDSFINRNAAVEGVTYECLSAASGSHIC